MKKKKSDHFALCYLGLGVLVFLLLLPVALRLFGKNLYEKKEVKKDVVTLLNCNKKSETVSSTFLNEDPKNLNYKIGGDYSTVQINDTDEQEIDMSSKTATVFIELIKDYAKIEYSHIDNATSFNVDVKDLKQVPNYVGIFSSIENQNKYFSSQGFSCTITNY